MKKYFIKMAAVAVAVTAVLSFSNQSEMETGKEKWITLFDGKTFNGWHLYNQTGAIKNWTIEEDAMVCLGAAADAHGGDIVTDELFSAFELQFEFRLTEGANSGVKYFVTEKEQSSGSAIGLEYQVLDDEKHPDAKLGTAGNRTLGGLYDLIPPIKYGQAYRQIGDWNRGMIRVYKDNHVEHFLNGYKIVEYQRGSQMFRALVARSKYNVWPDFGEAKEGRILLQDHGNAVDFRSIKIKTL